MYVCRVSATCDNALSMMTGDQFTIVERDCGDGWVQVRASSGDVGYVPSSYVECQFAIWSSPTAVGLLLHQQTLACVGLWLKMMTDETFVGQLCCTATSCMYVVGCCIPRFVVQLHNNLCQTCLLSNRILQQVDCLSSALLSLWQHWLVGMQCCNIWKTLEKQNRHFTGFLSDRETEVDHPLTGKASSGETLNWWTRPDLF